MNEIKLIDDTSRRFDGDILITDPCYILKKEEPRDYSTVPKYKDYVTHENLSDYPGESQEEKINAMREEHQAYRKAKRQWEIDHPYADPWTECGYGSHLEVFGIKNYMTRDTIYGDWSCTVFDTDTEEAIGKFCADAGLVSVLLLDEVRNYNPEIDEWIKSHDWCATVIKDFHGDIHFKVYEEEFKYKGDTWKDHLLRVEGHGNINFVGCQTGL